MSILTLGKRKRARKACEPCHRRKRKCDGKQPCSMCIAFEYTCVFADQNAARSIDIHYTTNTAASTGAFPSPAVSQPSPAKSQDSRRDNSPYEHRATESSAAMTFPRILGRKLGCNENTAEDSTAYTFGLRNEEASNNYGSLLDLISEDDLSSYSNVYFSALGPIGELADPRIYAQRCIDYYRNGGNGFTDTSSTFGAVAAGIAALGSFLSPARHPRESKLVHYCKTILDDPASMRKLEPDLIIAWAMRVFYLRATTRPSTAWIASCTMMHLCEAVGLHEEVQIQKIAAAAGAASLGHDEDRLRRIFWISWAGHTLLSYEYDRSSVGFRTITTQAIMSVPGSLADQFVRVAQIIPGLNSPLELASHPRTETEELFERLKALQDLQLSDPFLLITRADVALCFYRRAYQLKSGVSDDFIRMVISNGNVAVAAGEALARQGRFFWNIISSVFHYTCILLAIDTPEASAQMPSAFKGLETLIMAADTTHTREALAAANRLLDLHLDKKRRELAQLEPIQARYQSSHAGLAASDPEIIDMPDLIDWDQFLLEPYFSMFSADA